MAIPAALRSTPPAANERARVGPPVDLGVGLSTPSLPAASGQRMGIFAGSGVGKSVLMSMLARNMSADVAVIGLIGERGREVQEFIEDDLGPEGLARAVVVVATSDESRAHAPAGGLYDDDGRRIFPRSGEKTCFA